VVRIYAVLSCLDFGKSYKPIIDHILGSALRDERKILRAELAIHLHNIERNSGIKEIRGFAYHSSKFLENDSCAFVVRRLYLGKVSANET
jgi:hypothetical protein